MGKVLNDAVNELTEIFRSASHKRGAHAEARPVLEQVSRTPAFLREALESYVPTMAALNHGNYPVLAVPIVSNPYFDLVLNCWIPLPNRDTHISTKAIHHHGTMLLSTATIFGPGYEHWLFTPPRPVNGDGQRYRMELLEVAQHPLHHIAFVDAKVAHVPIFPKDHSITLALWSDSAPTTWRDHLKRVPVVKKNAQTLRKVVVRAGLSKALAVKVVDTFDFYPAATGFVPMKEREEFALGPNEDHLHSLFCIVQCTGNEHIVRDVQKQMTALRISNASLVRQLIERVSAGQPVEGRLSPRHYGIPHANFTTTSIRDALRALEN